MIHTYLHAHSELRKMKAYVSGVWFVFLLIVCVWVGDKHTTHAVKNDASYLPPKEQ